MEKGVSKSLHEGVLAGFPIVDLKVTLYDGSYHSVDSSGMSFEIAGGMALKQGMAKAQPTLLEPVLMATITVPDAFTGEVVGDLNSKRAHIAGMTPSDGFTEVEATVPQSEMRRYAAELRALTQGRGYFTRRVQQLRAGASPGPAAHRGGSQEGTGGGQGVAQRRRPSLCPCPRSRGCRLGMGSPPAYDSGRPATP